MSYNLTNKQKALITWIVHEIRAGNLDEEFSIAWIMNEPGYIFLGGHKGSKEGLPIISKGILDALEASDMILCNIQMRESSSGHQYESGRSCVLREKAYEATESNFAAPDISFITHLTPLADITNLDEDLKSRCLPILGAGSADPKLWDSAVRTSGVILEERMRDVGNITDSSRVGRDLVNEVFSQQGTLSAKFTNDSERQGYRDLYAGVVGAFRNPYAHRLVDPSAEDGGAYILFVNLLLRMLEDLR